jgi:hypothetical protein
VKIKRHLDLVFPKKIFDIDLDTVEFGVVDGEEAPIAAKEEKLGGGG